MLGERFSGSGGRGDGDLLKQLLGVREWRLSFQSHDWFGNQHFLFSYVRERRPSCRQNLRVKSSIRERMRKLEHREFLSWRNPDDSTR